MQKTHSQQTLERKGLPCVWDGVAKRTSPYRIAACAVLTAPYMTVRCCMFPSMVHAPCPCRHPRRRAAGHSVRHAGGEPHSACELSCHRDGGLYSSLQSAAHARGTTGPNGAIVPPHASGFCVSHRFSAQPYSVDGIAVPSDTRFCPCSFVAPDPHLAPVPHPGRPAAEPAGRGPSPHRPAKTHGPIPAAQRRGRHPRGGPGRKAGYGVHE